MHLTHAHHHSYNSYCAEHTGYHHGEASLHATIVHMAQSYVGSNNLPLLEPVGQFGTRLAGGRDAASARYIFTTLAPLTRTHLFPVADDALLEHLMDDGEVVEPRHYVPIIPLVLVNGAEGIGTGWSTSVPAHHPCAVIDAALAHLGQGADAGEHRELRPWYRGFRGRMVPFEGAKAGRGYTVHGEASVGAHSRVQITELPVGVWTDKYKAFLLGLADRGIVHSFREQHTEERVHFDVRLTPAGKQRYLGGGGDESMAAEQLASALRLSRNLNTGNMHLFDANGNMKRYDSAEQVLHDHAEVRLGLYGRRLELQAAQLDAQASRLRNVSRFVGAVVGGSIRPADTSRADLENSLAEQGYDPESSFEVALGDSKEGDGQQGAAASSSRGSSAAKEYAYLLSLPLWQLTGDAIATAQQQLAALAQEREEVAAATPEGVWAAELHQLRSALVADGKGDFGGEGSQGHWHDDATLKL